MIFAALRSCFCRDYAPSPWRRRKGGEVRRRGEEEGVGKDREARRKAER